MLSVTLKNPEMVENFNINNIKASQHANSTKIHKTALLNINYDCEIKLKKKHFIFVVDTSKSMEVYKDVTLDTNETQSKTSKVNVTKTDKDKIFRIDSAKKAILTIVNKCEKDSPDNIYSVIAFNTKAEIISDGKNKNDISQKIQDLKIDDGTSIYHGILKIKDLDSFNQLPISNTIIILLSDGYSTIINEDSPIVFYDIAKPADYKNFLEKKSEYLEKNITSNKEKEIIKKAQPIGKIQPVEEVQGLTEAQGSEVVEEIEEAQEAQEKVTPVKVRVKVEYKYFDPEEAIKNLSRDGELPRIFPMGIGENYNLDYLNKLSHITRTPVTHITKQSDFSKALDLGLFDLIEIPSTIKIQNSNEIVSSNEVVLHSGKEKEIIIDIDKEVLTNLLTNSKIQIKVNDNTVKSINVDSKQIGKIDKEITLKCYKIKKTDQLHLTENISQSLMWDIPQTGEFCADQECKEERKKLLQEIKVLNEKKKKETLSLSSNIGYASQGHSYFTVTDPVIIQEMEKEKKHTSSISLEVTDKPTSVLAFDEISGFASVQTYNKDEIFKLANLDPQKNTREELTKTFRTKTIKDPMTNLRMIEPVHDEVKVEKMTKDADKKAQEQDASNIKAEDTTLLSSTEQTQPSTTMNSAICSSLNKAQFKNK